MRITTEMFEGGRNAPFYYGIAWREPTMAEVVYFPIPLNYIARFFREFWFRLRFPSPTFREKYEHRIKREINDKIGVDWRRFDERVESEICRRLNNGIKMLAEERKQRGNN